MIYSKANTRLWSRLGSCGAYGQAALELAETNEKALFVTADLCYYSGLDRLKTQHPDKFINVGIAEQNMVGVAAGLASEGFTPFASTYATFASMRCADQVRVNMGYMQLGVKLIGLTSGLSVGILGPTHISIEDIAVMRAIPNITIISPADCTETVKAVLATSKNDTPTYIRLSGGMPNPIVYSEDYDYTIGKAITLKDGKDALIYATGTMVYNALKASDHLEKRGIKVTVVDIHTIKPLDNDYIIGNSDYEYIFTVEEHSVIGGLGSAIKDLLSERNKAVHKIGINDYYNHAAEYDYLLKTNGLTPEGIANKIADTIKERG